jgi:hypothetical protein
LIVNFILLFVLVIFVFDKNKNLNRSDGSDSVDLSTDVDRPIYYINGNQDEEEGDEVQSDTDQQQMFMYGVSPDREDGIVQDDSLQMVHPAVGVVRDESNELMEESRQSSHVRGMCRTRIHQDEDVVDNDNDVNEDGALQYDNFDDEDQNAQQANCTECVHGQDQSDNGEDEDLFGIGGDTGL